MPDPVIARKGLGRNEIGISYASEARPVPGWEVFGIGHPAPLALYAV